MSDPRSTEKELGVYLRNARLKLNPAALGFPAIRRRTPGLRREEVAQRAALSVTWYTWLEQGRGGMPAPAALERLSDALMLTDAEREHLFLLGLGRAPKARYRQDMGVTPRLQRVLDKLDPNPAFIRSATWQMIAWNRAATELMTDFALLPPEHRNILRLIFLDPRSRTLHPDWENAARFIVSSFRVDVARAGASETLWSRNSVRPVLNSGRCGMTGRSIPSSTGRRRSIIRFMVPRPSRFQPLPLTVVPT